MLSEERKCGSGKRTEKSVGSDGRSGAVLSRLVNCMHGMGREKEVLILTIKYMHL